MKSSPHTCPINKGFWVGNKIVNGTAVISGKCHFTLPQHLKSADPGQVHGQNKVKTALINYFYHPLRVF